MRRFVKFATPPTAATDVVPESTPVPGFVVIAIATVPVKLVTRLFDASCACTLGLAVTGTPAVLAPGGVTKTSFVAAPAAELALKVSGELVSVPLVAVTVFDPATAPIVSVV